jgi:FKBP-type peptidyl-prolyl cis-trans isomerase 2
MAISFNSVMQKEKIALVMLVIVIIAALSVFVVAVNTNYLDTLFQGEKIITYGDYADVNYIGHYASNGTIFGSSYKYPGNKSGATALKIFVTLNESASPGANFSAYTSTINDEYVKGFIENLKDMKQGQTKTTSVIPPENAYGVSPKAGDVINLTILAGKDYRISIVSVERNVTMPAMFVQYFGSSNTDMYTIREESHHIGEYIDTYYDASFNPLWNNATVVTRLNATQLWKYTTPDPNLLTNLTWVDTSTDSNPDTAFTTIYPTNGSSITSLNNSTFVVTHNVKIHDTVRYYNTTYQSGADFIISDITAQNITAYYNTSSDNQTTKIIRVFPRTIAYPRNTTQNITQPYPKEYIAYALSILRTYDHRVTLSLGPLADQTVYFDITVVKVYKAS